ncbi:CsbD family protein [Erythrobacter sanguineus]|jgi:uncharacterized protein YjbJ (UPF0337 family)|uniref:CsbD-like n=1 Tax=Erythrobacter sanguineus TaxID=198312 RepID=A0A1M7SAC2_9SPHN|nr:CsbD family protein [Erythrobacter sanguineus]SHN55365.1 hypothetical protein SAMN02745193_01322 [Erythrobacter sanguineus]
MGELTDKIKGSVQEALGEAKQLSDDPETKAEGKKQELKGKADKAKGEIKGAMGDRI